MPTLLETIPFFSKIRWTIIVGGGIGTTVYILEYSYLRHQNQNGAGDPPTKRGVSIYELFSSTYLLIQEIPAYKIKGIKFG